jgi:hypothetical protein
VTVQPTYEFTSICGQNFQTSDPSQRVCPLCGRSMVLDWKPILPSNGGEVRLDEAEA